MHKCVRIDASDSRVFSLELRQYESWLRHVLFNKNEWQDATFRNNEEERTVASYLKSFGEFVLLA